MIANHRATLHAVVGLVASLIIPLPVHASLVLTFVDSVGHAAPVDNSPCSAIAWEEGAEFRVCDSTGLYLVGDQPNAKNVISGGEQWNFNDAGVLIGVNGMPGNIGIDESFGTGSAAPAAESNPSLLQTYPFLGVLAGFLAPVQGSLAGDAYGPGAYIGGVPAEADGIALLNFPVIEWQWAGGFMTPGQASGGVTFYADIFNVASLPSLGTNSTAFEFHLHASELIEPGEDPLAIGFSGFTFQWELQGYGVYTSPVPLPPALWLLGSGLLGLIGVARRRRLR